VLWGWSPREHTEYHYDDAGLLVGSTTTREPEFDATQRALVRTVQEQLDMVGPHGHPMDEATSPLADPNEPGGWYYAAGVEIVNPAGQRRRVPIVDFAEKALLDAQDAYRKAAGDDANLNGLHWPVRRIDRT